MKKIIASTLAAAGFFGAGLAQAAGADLSVKGTLRPDSCNVVLGNGGVVDLGSINAGSLVFENGYAVFVPDAIAMTITCSTPMIFGVLFQDNRSSTFSPDTYGLGTSGGKEIGHYHIFSFDHTSGGQPIDTMVRTPLGNWFNTGRVATYSAEGTTPFFFTGFLHSSGPVAYSEVRSQLQNQVFIRDPANGGADLSQEIQLDGSATLELVYL